MPHFPSRLTTGNLTLHFTRTKIRLNASTNYCHRHITTRDGHGQKKINCYWVTMYTHTRITAHLSTRCWRTKLQGGAKQVQ